MKTPQLMVRSMVVVVVVMIHVATHCIAPNLLHYLPEIVAVSSLYFLHFDQFPDFFVMGLEILQEGVEAPAVLFIVLFQVIWAIVIRNIPCSFFVFSGLLVRILIVLLV